MTKLNSWISALSMLLATNGNLFAQDVDMKLLGDFEENWRENWVTRGIGKSAINFEDVTEGDNNLVLRASGSNAASSLWRMLQIKAGPKAKLTWDWKVDNPLNEKANLKRKSEDDYAARLIVVFEPHLVSWKTRAVCYVWAPNGKIGSMYRSPYSSSLGIVVVQSGRDKRDKWVSEERDPIADYKKIFGDSPQMITGLAIMVDTDNTDQEALSWFDNLKIAVSAPQEAEPERPKLFKPND